MERTIPRTASEEIELYLRTYYSLLRSGTAIQIRALEEVHASMNSLLHRAAHEQAPDMSAFIYSVLRLPACMSQVRLVVLGQSSSMFARHGVGEVESWARVSAPARRRLCYFDGQETLACFVASRSDVDDLVPILTAYQIEWNKLHRLMRELPNSSLLDSVAEEPAARQDLAAALHMAHDDLERLQTIWGSAFVPQLKQIADAPRKLRVQLLSSSYNEYRRATQAWWQHIEQSNPRLLAQPVYFVSSNTHSLVNLLSGHALRHQAELVKFLEQSGNTNLLNEWQDIQTRQVASSRENFLYYVLKIYKQTSGGRTLAASHGEVEQLCSILRLPSQHTFDIEAQVIELSCLRPDLIDPRLQAADLSYLARSDALILNIDYPLGLAAYHILTQVAEMVGEVLGIYVAGKAATLNGVIGDVMIPRVVHDEHSHNTFLFPNCITAAEVDPYLAYGTVLDNQKSITVRGTFLQNASYMDVFYREGYTDIEMEAGPYLSAVYELYRPNRHPVDEIVNLHGIPFDLGVVHYASDTPLSKGKNLGAGSLSYFGMDPTYATALAILRRIFELERERVGP